MLRLIFRGSLALIRIILRPFLVMSARQRYKRGESEQFEQARRTLKQALSDANPTETKVLVLECYNAKLNDYFSEIIELASQRSFCVVVVNNNTSVSTPEIKPLPQFSSTCFWFDTYNIGRDIGARKLAWEQLIQSQEYSFERAVFINDSTLILRKEELIHGLDLEGNQLAMTSMPSQPVPHPQSFIWSLPAPLLDDATIQNLFVSYEPLNDRWWAIQKGEIELGKAVMQRAYALKCSTNFLFLDDIQSTSLEHLSKKELIEKGLANKNDRVQSAENAITYTNFCISVGKVPLLVKKEHASLAPSLKFPFLSEELSPNVHDELVRLFSTRKPDTFWSQIKRSLGLQV
ncbi:MAG: hypothetical protein ACPGMR_06020 [Pontibacterium sp.]